MDGRWERLSDRITEAESSGYTIGTAFLFPDGSEHAHNGTKITLAASTIKMAVMVAIFQHIDDGQMALDDTVILDPSHKVPGSGVIQGLHDGIPLTLADLLYLMISISDNPATNLLINQVGIDAVNQTMLRLGMTQSKLVRLMEGRDAQGFGNENLATPKEFAHLCKTILSGTAASIESCDSMTKLLTQQQNLRRIGRAVPRSDTFRWGSKTGTSAGLVNDVGFVEGPGGTVILSIFASGFPDILVGEQLVANLAYEALLASGLI